MITPQYTTIYQEVEKLYVGIVILFLESRKNLIESHSNRPNILNH